MKYIWEESDIEYGMFVCKKDANTKYLYQIGYDFTKDSKYVTIALCDGQITYRTKNELVLFLNKNELMPTPINLLKKMIEEIHSYDNN